MREPCKLSVLRGLGALFAGFGTVAGFDTVAGIVGCILK